jgi:hypothetical protein
MLRQQAVQVQQQGGLARPIGTDQTDAFAFGDGKRHIAQGFSAVRITVTEVVNFEGVHSLHPRAHMAA